jgi:hypothetical protein
MADNRLFSYQGRVFLATRGSAGKPLLPQWVGDATLNIELSTETVDHNESFSGQRALYGQMSTKQSANATLTLYEDTLDNLAVALYGNKVLTAGASVTGEALPADAAVDDLIRLDYPFVSNVQLEDSASTALTEGVHWELERPEAGLIRLLDLGTFVAPFSADYDYAATEGVTLFSTIPPERWLIMDGVNTLSNEAVIVELYRVKFNPSNSLSLHNDEFGSFELAGAALYDQALANDSALGGFGRITRKAAV